jgi:hypothetical protein
MCHICVNYSIDLKCANYIQLCITHCNKTQEISPLTPYRVSLIAIHISFWFCRGGGGGKAQPPFTDHVKESKYQLVHIIVAESEPRGAASFALLERQPYQNVAFLFDFLNYISRRKGAGAGSGAGAIFFFLSVAGAAQNYAAPLLQCATV